MSVLQEEKSSLEANTSTPSAPAASASDHRPALSSAGSRTTRSPTRSEPNAGNSISAPVAAPIPAGKKTPSKLVRANTASLKDADDSLRGSAVARATPPPSAPSPANSTAIDPLSQHIFLRTNTDHSIPSRLRNQPRPESPLATDGLPRPSSDLSTKFNTPITDAGRDKKKTGSFLSRLSMRGSKRRDDDDDESEVSEQRMEGVNALVFANSGAGGGYIPIHKEPPRYIKIKAHNKKHKEFDRMFLAQELVGTRPPKTATELNDSYPVVTVSVPGGGRKRAETGGAIWASEFSKDGKYFAVAGRDKVVRIWAVITTHEERRAHEEEEAASGTTTGERLSAPVFREKPICEFEGHTGEVLDISWSKNNFLLSTSMDKTVRLWHMSRNECLCTFKHKELVSKVAFHPTDDRFFLAGSLDAALRLWSIPDKSVAYSAQLTDLITAVAFSPDGKTAIAGQLSGVCTFFETEGLKLQAQVHVRSSRGKNAKGSKITGIQTLQEPSKGRREGDVKLLITSTDSRIRVYSLRDKTLEMKLKGHEHTCSQLFASFSDDGAYIICGSEDRKAFIWNTSSTESENRDKKPCEYFNAHSDVVTTAVFAPTKSRQLLGSSGDPIYDLCNPPPVTLMSVEETTTSQPSEDLNHGAAETSAQPPPTVKKPEESPAYIARSTHYDGNILVTTDDMGIIKVFRQDCAWAKRKHETWETGSTFSRRMGGSGLIGRSASIITRTSQGSVPHSRRGSLSQPPVGFPGVVSGPPSATSTPQLGGHDRILSWRQGIVSHGGQSRPVSMVTPTRSERSLSPGKGARSGMPMSASAGNMARSSPLASQFNIKSDPMSPLSGTFSHLSLTKEERSHEDRESIQKKKKNSIDANKKASPEAGRRSNATDAGGSKERKMSYDGVNKTSGKRDKDKGIEDEPTHPPTPSFSFRPADVDDAEEDHLRLDPAGASYSFWNLNRWKGIAGLRASISGAPPDASKQNGRSSSEAREGETSPGAADDAGGGSRRKSAAGSLFGKPSPLSRGDSVSMDAAAENGGRRRSSAAAVSHATTDDDDGRHLSPHGGTRHRGRSPLSGGSRGNSIVSRLSSELTSEEASEAGPDGEEEDMRCAKCGGRKFKARRLEGSARQRLVCGRCGKVVDD
ncbi:uncharacterized protein E0L32_003386 [Thyridium curvatum]|uniref:Uncharacterized protein n=1 Tax=Thyridium curvatum TaxID=1093900 RepID=A0A507BDN7_9PEZI|nr:uncharacterized protein E0L32_003386 [Thyridium curvatum]TPX16824.1 hypothetical protein E0L32_003386 [Thyridium curvatum]